MAKASDNPYPSLLLVEQSAAPATPASGQARLYRGTDNKLYIVDDAGLATEVGAGGGGSSPLVLLKAITLAAAAASVTFSSSDIPSSGYRHLRIEALCRTTVAGSEVINVEVNGDTTAANYYSSGDSMAGASSNRIGIVSGDVAAGQPGRLGIFLPEYLGTTWQKLFESRYWSGEPIRGSANTLWRNAAAVTSLTLRAPSTSFVVGSKFLLYGERDVTS